MELEEIRRKAQNAITATDKEWAKVVFYLLDQVEGLEEDIKELEQDLQLELENSDRLYYGG